jgi:hypothetical protein
LKDCRRICVVALALSIAIEGCATDAPKERLRVDPVEMALNLPDTGFDSSHIEFDKLPRLTGQHAIVSARDAHLPFQLHSYLLFHGGQYWCMWSQGPPIEDEATQEVRYATSPDGLHWSESASLTGPPESGYGYIARGFWVRDGKLHALVAHFIGKGAFGHNKDLSIQAFDWDEAAHGWKRGKTLYEDAINNFAPQMLANGEWMMIRRDSHFNVFVLTGGRKAIDDWDSVAMVRRGQVRGFIPDEPIWWPLADGSLVSLFRDNASSGWLYRSVSTDNAKTWTTPRPTNLPSAPSKLYALRVDGECEALISNANVVAQRRQLYLSTAPDGRMFTRMALLVIPRAGSTTVQYPHAIVHDGSLLITFSRNKAAIEVLKVPLSDVRAMCQQG